MQQYVLQYVQVALREILAKFVFCVAKAYFCMVNTLMYELDLTWHKFDV